MQILWVIFYVYFCATITTMERVELPSIVQEASKQIILFAGIAVRLAVCPGDDIALVSGTFAAGTGRDNGVMRQ